MRKTDIEDIIVPATIVKSGSIRKNIPIYRGMILDVIEWVHQHQRDNVNIRKEFNTYYNKLVRMYRVYCKKSILVCVYRDMVQSHIIEYEPFIMTLLQKRPIRNMSGITNITVLTSPYPDGQTFSCKHNCYYCPNEPGQPRSYLKKEPAVARANRNEFDAIRQMEDRIHSLIVNGHEIDKLEIIIEGGTYTEYPVSYLKRFHRDLIYCANTYFDAEDHRRAPFEIDEEIRINATTRVRIIGICIETRPDALIDAVTGIKWVRHFRDWGVTRVQLGVQHVCNDILKKVNRGHTYEDAISAVAYLKNNGFKVDIHLMPDLPGATPEKDIAMFDRVYSVGPNAMQPDQIKIYPCEVTDWTIIKRWHEQGKYLPYAQTDERALFEVVKYAMEQCPSWIRLPRVIRDIPLSYIHAGNMKPNLRQMLTNELDKEGKSIMEIRARECGRHPEYNRKNAVYSSYKYESLGGLDYFLALESPDKKCLFGFLRLRIPNKLEEGGINQCEFECLHGVALIRELHVYGVVTPVGESKSHAPQHTGIGTLLLQRGEQLAAMHGHDTIAVISGIGVTEYYAKRGYVMNDTYMIKTLPCNDTLWMGIYLLGMLGICWTIVISL